MKRWAGRLVTLMKELPPDQVPLLLSLGLVLGVFPIFGLPTIFCLVAACGLRLNVAALQVVNQIASPIRLILLLPMAHAGARLCAGTLPLGNLTGTRLETAAVHAIVGWACVCIPAGVVLYVALILLARKLRIPWSNFRGELRVG